MQSHPPIVTAAAQGDLNTVNQLLAAGVPVDSCRVWTDTEEKYGYSKSWTCKSDTALCKAVRGGHTDVVVALLAAGANPLYQVCNGGDNQETPRSIAKEVKAKHPACAHALLGPAFEEQRAKAEATLNLACPSIFELAACELRVATALEQVPKSLEQLSDHSLPFQSLYDVGRVLEACESSSLACVPEEMCSLVKDAWKHASARACAQTEASKAYITLGHLYVRGEGVAVDEDAAVLWLSRGLEAHPMKDIALCWRWHAESGDQYCSHCQLCKEARATLTTMTGAGSAAAGAAAKAALAADEQCSVALLDTSLYRLELLRQQAKERQWELMQVEKKRKEKERAEKQRLQDERFNREVRDPEVARCAQFAERRRESGGGGVCYDEYCDDRQDYCTYLHSGKNDLPPRCQWFQSGKCRNGARCWYNHLPRKPPPVPFE